MRLATLPILALHRQLYVQSEISGLLDMGNNKSFRDYEKPEKVILGIRKSAARRISQMSEACLTVADCETPVSRSLHAGYERSVSMSRRSVIGTHIRKCVEWLANLCSAG